jgi:hypothetical protein
MTIGRTGCQMSAFQIADCGQIACGPDRTHCPPTQARRANTCTHLREGMRPPRSRNTASCALGQAHRANTCIAFHDRTFPLRNRGKASCALDLVDHVSIGTAFLCRIHLLQMRNTVPFWRISGSAVCPHGYTCNHRPSGSDRAENVGTD